MAKMAELLDKMEKDQIFFRIWSYSAKICVYDYFSFYGVILWKMFQAPPRKYRGTEI